MSRRLFCEINPFCYAISVKKERFIRRIKDAFGGEKFAKGTSDKELPCIISSHSSPLMRRLHGVDASLQENKITNIKLACEKVNGTVVYPGQTFSYWKTVGNPTAKRGYKEGLIISKGRLSSGIGGGMCQMGNLIHYLVLNSPLEVTELHHHSDALFPDDRRRVPFGTGTSIFYNYIDYRFKNTTDQPVQLLLWTEDEELCGELRSERETPYRYKLIEEGHCFKKEGGDYYRISEVYRSVIDKNTGKEIRRELILKNHSKVMYDHSLIPKEQIKNDN
ncbi:MAG: VanW family protein [Clostridia bacterium]|jgi:vancomycin resistance protein VanW|nr:VanW family protein [Clostridia bacterium]